MSSLWRCSTHAWRRTKTFVTFQYTNLAQNGNTIYCRCHSLRMEHCDESNAPDGLNLMNYGVALILSIWNVNAVVPSIRSIVQCKCVLGHLFWQRWAPMATNTFELVFLFIFYWFRQTTNLNSVALDVNVHARNRRRFSFRLKFHLPLAEVRLQLFCKNQKWQSDFVGGAIDHWIIEYSQTPAMTCQRRTSHFIVICWIAVSLMVSNCVAKYVEGHLKSSDVRIRILCISNLIWMKLAIFSPFHSQDWAFLSRFCFLSGKIGTRCVRVCYHFHTQLLTGRGKYEYEIEFDRRYGEPQLLLYYDDKTQWPSVYKSGKVSRWPVRAVQFDS